jgi:AsmA-like C-terminal region
MVAGTVPPPAKTSPRESRAPFLGKMVFILLLLAVVCGVVFLHSPLGPFQQKSVIENLQEAADSQVKVRAFRQTYFPNPGCILEGVVFQHQDGSVPLMTVEKLTIRGTYGGTLRRQVSLIQAEGLHIFIPAFGSGQHFHSERSTITVGEMVANGATLEFASHQPGVPPLRFDIREASLRDVGWNGPFTYRLQVHNPEPPGEVITTGKFGLWNENDPAETPISGDYKFEQADLSVYQGISGLLSSVGKYDGNLSHINISGTTDTPDFEVKSSGHAVHLKTEFNAFVDAMHGDAFLNRVDAHFRSTHVVADGSIAGSATRKGKVALLRLSVRNGRIEDLLGLFVKDRPPMSGLVSSQAKVEIPSGPMPFLRRVKLRGTFGIGGGAFAEPSTQQGVNQLSAGALGEKSTDDPETALTDLTGGVDLDNGIAHFVDLSFGIPGAHARMHGTYGLIDEKVDLRGQMRVQTKISNTTSGPKALLLKIMDPFFKKRKKGEVLPVRISGTFDRPSFGLDLMDKNAQNPPRTIPPPPH